MRIIRPNRFSDTRWYGRRRGRPLRKGQKFLIDHLLPNYRVKLPIIHKAQIDLNKLFGKIPNAIWMEIGFGFGEHIADLAIKNPRIGFIGCDPYINGVASLLAKIKYEGIENIRIFDNDVRLLFPFLPEACIERLLILFADPWPKHRHRGRRITVDDNLSEFARILANDGQLLFATDQHKFAAWSLANILRERRLQWTAHQSKDWREEPEGWTPTRYYIKARNNGKNPLYIHVKRRPRNSEF